MHFHQHLFRSAIGIIALSFSLTACHGGPASSSYVPAYTAGDVTVKVTIRSSCGDRLDLVKLKSTDCLFREPGYGDGIFTVKSDDPLLVAVSPSKGTRKTVFKVKALLAGLARVTVRDDRGHALVLKVRIKL